MGWIGCVRCEKFGRDFVVRTFCTCSARFPPSFVRQPNGPECTQIVRNAPECQFRVQWGWIGCICCEKFRGKFVARTFALVCTEFRKATKRSRMHPNSMKRTKMAVLGPMGWIGCVRCEKFRRDFVARTFALVRPVLYRVSQGKQTVPNGPK